VEAEASYRSNEVRDLRFVRNGELANKPDVQGRTGTAALMLNLLYDFDLRRWGISVRPYIGGGIGYGWRDYDGVSASTPFVVATPTGFVTGPGRTSLRGSYGDFAWQAIGGVAIPLRFVPGLELTAEYRYFSMDGTKFEARQTLGFTNPNPGGTQSNRRFGRDDNHNHAALIGLRYAFNTPRPAPVAAVAPVPQAAPVARTYLVFFDWDRADLTDRARQIIADAAANARNTRSTRIEVSGHADRSVRRSTTSACRSAARKRWRPSWCARACRATRSACRPSAKAVRWCPPPTTCASRRTAASRSSCARGARAPAKGRSSCAKGATSLRGASASLCVSRVSAPLGGIGSRQQRGGRESKRAGRVTCRPAAFHHRRQCRPSPFGIGMLEVACASRRAKGRRSSPTPLRECTS
jgi:opacity protein-like surface antigen